MLYVGVRMHDRDPDGIVAMELLNTQMDSGQGISSKNLAVARLARDVQENFNPAYLSPPVLAMISETTGWKQRG